MADNLPPTDVCAIEPQGDWHCQEISSREQGQQAAQDVAEAAAGMGFATADVKKVRLLVEQALLQAVAPGIAVGVAAPLQLSYRLGATYFQAQVDGPPGARQRGERKSIRVLVVRAGYALWHEYAGREGQWRLRRHRFVP